MPPKKAQSREKNASDPARWTALYDAADALHALAPWTWMTDDLIFATVDPRSGVPGYCSVMGTLGEHLALSVYLGNQGLVGLEIIVEGGESANQTQVLASMSCLMISFEDRELLEASDRAQIKALGRRYRGSMAWPLFRSYMPGYLPYQLEADEVETLLVAIEQTLLVAPRLRDDPHALNKPDGQMLHRVFADGAFHDEWREPPEVVHPIPTPQVDPDALAHIRQRGQGMPRRGTWEIAISPEGMPVGQQGTRPMLASPLLVVDSGSGMILSSDVVPIIQRDAAVPVSLLGALGRSPLWPEAIDVSDPDLAELLQPVATGLGLPVRLRKKLPAATAALVSLSQYLARGV